MLGPRLGLELGLVCRGAESRVKVRVRVSDRVRARVEGSHTIGVG